MNIFLVIKSFFHKDRFHHKRNEHINLVVRKNKLKEDLKLLVYYLQRYISEERKKFNNNIVFDNLIGVTNYLNTLLEIIKNYDKTYYEQKIKYIQNLKYSLEKEKNEKTLFSNLFFSSAIASLSFVGVYKILEINAVSETQQKIEVLNNFIPSLVNYFFIILFVFILIDYLINRCIPISLSKNPVNIFLVKIYNGFCEFLIKNNKPLLGKNKFQKIYFPKVRNLIKKIIRKIQQ